MERLRLSCHDADELAGLYVLDALEPSEMTAVSGHLLECPEAHPIFAELAATTSELLANVEPLDTSPAMRDRVMAAVAATPQLPDQIPIVGAREPSPLPVKRPEPTVRPVSAVRPAPAFQVGPAASDAPERVGWLDRLRGDSGGGRQNGWAWAGVAAGVMVILLVGVGILGAFRLAVDESDRLDLLRQAVAAAAARDTNVASLAATGTSSAFGYAVFPDDGAGFIVIDGLQSPGAGKAYQAWFLADGVPASAGLLTLDSDGLGTLTGLDPGVGTSVVAVTVEDARGAEAPTNDPILAGELRTATALADDWWLW